MQYHAKHAELLAAFSLIVPQGQVRVIDEPLRRPCSFAVVIDNRYTIAAPSAVGWEDVDRLREQGYDFSAAYERMFDRTWIEDAHKFMRREPDGTAAANSIVTATHKINVALDAAVAAILAEGELLHV